MKIFQLKKIVVLLPIPLLFLHLFNQIFYPSRICNGEISKKIIWQSKYGNEKITLKDEKSQMTMSFLVKKGSIYLNEDRFPFYKELSGEDKFSEKTEVGYYGYSKKYGFLKSQSLFEFRFNDVTSILNTINTGEAMHFYDGKEGKDYATLEFIGSCSRKFL